MQNDNPQTEEKPKTLKACCACKQTRTLRDDCLREFGEDKCQSFVNAHIECLKQKGFKVATESK